MLVALIVKDRTMSEKKTYRKFTPEQKVEIVLAGLRSDRTVRDVCRACEIAETLLTPLG
jgi:transposase